MSRVETITFGCRLNAGESDIIKQLAAGQSGTGAGADTVIVNSCAVTGEAVRQARQVVRRLAKTRPGWRVIVTGCAAQLSPDTFAALPGVARVLGNAEKLNPVHYRNDGGDKTRVGDIAQGAAVQTAAAQPVQTAGRIRMPVPVQTGCDHRCTFCIIPLARGPSRSMPVAQVAAQVARMAAGGVREVILTGVDLTAYGADLPGTPGLARLARAILAAAPELPRLRLSSIDSAEADEELIKAFAEEERLMPHVHLSLQSGDDMILKRMKRRHNRRDAENFCRQLRAARPDMVFGADLIAGFPTETDAMFANTQSLVESCGLTWLHVFPYSPRPGTPAARMPPVSGAVVRERAARLRALGARMAGQFLTGEIGRVRPVLMERDGRGRTENSAPVAVPDGRAGDLHPVLLTDHDGHSLSGRLTGRLAGDRRAS